MKPPIARLIASALIAVATFMPATSYAGSQSAPLTVTMAVVPACSISVTSNVAFTYDFLTTTTTPASTEGGVAISCEAGTYGTGYPAAHVQFGSGNTQSPDNCPICSFTMVGGGHGLGYNLSWTNTPTQPVATYQLSQTQTAANQPTNLTVYGFIPPGQNVPAGTYTDTVQVSVAF